MKNIIICLVLSICSWIYFIYSRKKDKHYEGDALDRFWRLGLDFRTLMWAAMTTGLTIYFIAKYMGSEE